MPSNFPDLTPASLFSAAKLSSLVAFAWVTPIVSSNTFTLHLERAWDPQKTVEVPNVVFVSGMVLLWRRQQVHWAFPSPQRVSLFQVFLQHDVAADIIRI